MAATIVGRDSELEAVDRLIDKVADGPATLVVEGEPGIGKTTLLRAGVEAARRRGMQVFACTGSPSHARLSYSGLAELFSEVGEDEMKGLAGPQREALDGALMRSGPAPDGVDPLAVAPATLQVLENLAAQGQVLIAIDDLQWLDLSTARVVQFCSRRLTAPARRSVAHVGLILSRRIGADEPETRASAVPADDWTEVVRLGSLPLPDVAGLVSDQAPRKLDRRELIRLHEASGGNPFYALELARALPSGAASGAALPLPETLEEVVSARTADLGDELEDVLFAVAAMANPTVDLVERLAGDEAEVLLEGAEERRLITRDGRRLRFAHPLLAHGIYSGVSAPRQREMHRRLSEVVSDPEERARHLAYAGVMPDAIDALQDAAEHVRARGAPGAAADLLELAIELGGDPALAVRTAQHHFDAGDPHRAQRFLEQGLETVPAGEARAEALLLLGEIHYYDNRYAEAREMLEAALLEAGSNERLRALIDLQLSLTRFNLGMWEESAASAHSALAGAERLGEPGLIGLTLGMAVLADFNNGQGLDEERLARSRELEDPQLHVSAAASPSSLAAILLFWTGQVDESRIALESTNRQWAEHGHEPALALAASLRVWLEFASGDLPATEQAAKEARDRLLELGTNAGTAQSLWVMGHAHALAGRTDEARASAMEAMELFRKAGWHNRTVWSLSTLGFAELSIGDYEAAAEALAPAAAAVVHMEPPEPVVLGMFFTADAAEALIAVGRTKEAEAIVSMIERNGAEQDRTWAIALGARCRGLMLAAEGSVEEAEGALNRALAAHDRLAIPVERARSLLVLGRVRRRLRKRRAAKEALDEALAIFEKIGSPRWAEQVRAEIDAIGLRLGAGDELTPAEKRVAGLAAQGLSNKEIAAALVVSAKTVEAHLGRTYRKLGVRSRVELAAKLSAD